ncbi:MBOAT family protein [Aquincola sp. S2]|uniref:Probable alginate O-acetylase AlgI n=1 Tax=Pseudaquabacterium terrae TaxID=2732868 RepID=A0ABX2EBI4_9BURK|nr:MBOAT family protein [Aquabacterium terrae]NRF66501.1 MBOAT family protein [Aquabacterium terrae]
MLFTTAAFLLLFLPVTLAGFFVLGRRSHAAAAGWLFLASLFFYGYWMPVFTLLLLASIGINFVTGRHIAQRVRGGAQADAKRWLVLGLVFNLGLLGYFKYANFFVDNLHALFGAQLSWTRVILPIGISFYSFTQIAFLVDAYEGKVDEANPVHYGLFVTYFPHLIAGPVLHHAQMMPQFADPAIYRPRADRLIGGLAIFAIGLLKKVVLADGVAPYADAVFRPADGGALPGMGEAWLGALAYTLQIYFDFSGYSDMAIGLSWLFNIRLPFNFDSPYQARSISDFWRRWHISLSTFLRDYLYIPLGGNRHGPARRYLNLATTMLLGGLWHGAGWTFVIWGGLHGLYLALNHGFRALLGAAHASLERQWLYRSASWLLTLLVVVLAWVFFRAETLGGALRMLQAMAGFGATSATPVQLWQAGLHASAGAWWCLALGAVALWAPNSNRIGERLLAELEKPAAWRPMLAGAALAATTLLLLVNVARDSVSAFIYFNF